MAFPNSPEWSWSHRDTAYSTHSMDSSSSAAGLLGEYGAPPTYFPPSQSTSYHHFNIQDGQTDQRTRPGSYSRGESRPHRASDEVMQSPLGQSLFHLFWTVLATIVFAVTAWFVQATFSAAKSASVLHAIQISFGSTVAVLRFLQGLTSTCISIALNQTFERIQWSLASGPGGVRLLSLLSLSPATNLHGISGIAFGWRPRLCDRMWALLRLTLLASVWVSGIVLFVNTSVSTLYDPIETFPVTAGTGQFNASLVDPFMAQYNGTIPYGALVYSFGLVGNPELTIEVDPVNCTTDQCESYLFPGGIETITPWTPTDHAEAPIVQINNAPAAQLQFQKGLAQGDGFVASDCTVFGSAEYLVGVTFCLANSQVLPGSYIAAIYVCTNGTSNGQCLTSGAAPNISTTFSVYSRQATATCARSNFSILAVSDLTPPTQNTNIDLKAFNKVMSWLLNYTAAKLPPAASIAFLFWDSQLQLGSNFWSTDIYGALKSLLSYVLWEFNVNNYGNSVMRPSPLKEVTYLPPEFNTTASICNPYLKVVVDPGMLATYLILQLVVLLFIWTTLVAFWLSGSLLPEISSYPLIDFATKSVERNVPDGRMGMDEKLEGVTYGGDARLRKELRDVKVFLRSDGGVRGKRTAAGVAEPNGDDGAVRRLIFVTDNGNGLERLGKGIKYQ